MSSKQQIKETINCLCRIIMYNNGRWIKPEVFRLAKFNKVEAVEAMWCLLRETVWFIKYNTFCAQNEFSTANTTHNIQWTKQELYKQGYYLKSFYDLPEDSSCGSQEILLAFGWLFSKANVLNKLLDGYHNMFEECMPVDQELLAPKQQRPNYDLTDNKVEENNEDTIDKIKQLSWLTGNLSFKFKGLFAAENKLASNIVRVHSFTMVGHETKGHLSTMEAYLLRHPKECDKLLNECQNFNSYVENLVKFVETQDVFWKWLQSVYNSKYSDYDQVGPEWNVKNQCRSCRNALKTKMFDINGLQDEIQNGFTNSEIETFYPKSTFNRTLRDFSDDLSFLKCNEKLRIFPEMKKVPCEKASVKSSVQKAIESVNKNIAKIELSIAELRNKHLQILNVMMEELEEAVLFTIENSKYKEIRSK
ncbi:uncharacterized protein LOC124448709 [Xenia sp. Carnegie-2017]|uniref:uncharacterized protein LOC124448709 n=1 Tax=Xenia sp. Carnegie-2017 TaxID=2897299 RepID=UPI001F0493DE|nr:uncharacterized protein LOC124448709 [Xenia sp. Carnegie-2017]